MAIYDQGFDITLKAGDYCKTTAAQYKCVGIPATDSAADLTAYMCNAGAAVNNTLTARCAIGIIQNLPSANCAEVTVRVLGVSKAICSGSISTGDFVYADYTISTTTKCGKILGGWGIGSTNSMSCVILGRALENGSSDTVIAIALAPILHINN